MRVHFCKFCKFFQGVFGLGRECVRIWKSDGWVKMREESVKKMRLFRLRYVRVDVREKFMGICEWCDDSWGDFDFDSLYISTVWEERIFIVHRYDSWGEFLF